MKRIRIISVRKNTDPHIRSLESDYFKRLKPYLKMDLEDIRQTYSAKTPLPLLLNREAELFEKKIQSTERFIVLHDRGRSFTSSEFARWLEKEFRAQNQPVIFLIGSAFSIHERLHQKARMVLSLSKMTLSHEHTRLILIEQIYRAMDILKGGLYHK